VQPLWLPMQQSLRGDEAAGLGVTRVAGLRINAGSQGDTRKVSATRMSLDGDMVGLERQNACCKHPMVKAERRRMT
jgi:hypothetical protein